jgi:hypothetical protein
MLVVGSRCWCSGLLVGCRSVGAVGWLLIVVGCCWSVLMVGSWFSLLLRVLLLGFYCCLVVDGCVAVG